MPQPAPRTPHPPPVPITIWLPAPSPPGIAWPAREDGWTPVTAWRLIATYSRPGDLVVTFDAPATTLTAASALGRRATAVVTVGSDTAGPAGPDEGRLPPTRRGGTRLVHAAPDELPGLLHGSAERVGMVLARLPRPAPPHPPNTGVSGFVEGCAVVLQPAGFLAVAVTAIDHCGRYVDHVSPLVAAAGTAGLTYHQHLVAIDEPLSEVSLEAGPRAAPPVTDEHWTGTHRRIHTDLFIFRRPGDRHA